MNDSRQIRSVLKALFASQRFAVLATQSEGQPYLSLMAFVVTGDLDRLIFATERDTRKYANLKSNARTAALVDNRSNERSDTENAVTVTAIGHASEMEGSEKEETLGIFVGRHPQLESFVRSPSCALIALEVESYYIVSQFQQVEEFHPISFLQ